MGRFFAGKTLPRKETASKSCWKLSSKSVTAIPKTGQNLPTTAWKYKLFFYGVRILKQFKACFWVNLSSTTIDNNRRRWLDCPLSKGNCAPNPKFERPNGKNTKSKKFLKSVQNWCAQLTWKLNEANSSKIWIESKQIKTNENQWHFLSFYI